MHALETAVHALKRHAIFDEGAPISFHVDSTTEMGGTYTGDTCPLLLGVGPSYLEGEELAIVRTVVTFDPANVLVISAMCKSPEDHLVLAEVSAYLAGRLKIFALLETHVALPASVAGAGIYTSIQRRPDYSFALVDHRVLRAWTRNSLFRLVK